MSGATPPLPLHAFMALTGTILRLPLSVYVLFDYFFIDLFIHGVLTDTVIGLFSVECSDTW
jgi:hypothetical protein